MHSPETKIKRFKPAITWLFDLDNTLHDASHAIFPAINANMNSYMAQVLGQDGRPADPATVDAVRLDYWRRYGATLLGMVKHHGVRAADFLQAAHQFDNLPSMIRAERGLDRLLRRLPGRKILLTNAPRGYSHEVMRHLGLHRHFARHIAIESMMVHGQLRPKPSRLLLRKIVTRERLAARRCILVEDTAPTLKAAKTLGLRTAWITRYLGRATRRTGVTATPHPAALTKCPIYVDVKVKSIAELAKRLRHLR
ncbi:MAG: HAD family hydrolase [Burkholderiaceae bacterium]|nr:HAD family hydrolase [Burkholderiaceae bacterium]